MSKTNDKDSGKSKWEKFANKQEDAPIAEEPVIDSTKASLEEVFIDGDIKEAGAGSSEVPAETVDGTPIVESETTEEVMALRHDLQKMEEKILRIEAEKQNYTARTERELKKAREFANQSLLKELLPVVDGLNRGLDGVDISNEQLAPIVTGMNMTKELLERTIIKFGVAILNPEVGSTFDPELHEAMSMQPCPGMESNKIVKVLDKGYQLNGRVLRAAMVVVSS